MKTTRKKAGLTHFVFHYVNYSCEWHISAALTIRTILDHVLFSMQETEKLSDLCAPLSDKLKSLLITDLQITQNNNVQEEYLAPR